MASKQCVDGYGSARSSARSSTRSIVWSCGKSVSTVRRIVLEGELNNAVFSTPGKHRKGRPKKELDDFDLCAIRQKVQFCYTVKKEAAAEQVFADVSVDDWKNSCQHVMKIEEEYYARGNTLYQDIDRLVINVQDDSTTDDTSDYSEVEYLEEEYLEEHEEISDEITMLQALFVTECLALNVRTTLFTPADLAKRRWTKRDAAVLRARMYFQGLIPPMEVSQSPEYTHALTRYIEHCYTAVNRAALDNESVMILTLALSDVLGGYLKMIALPVTKQAYYSGDLSTEEAMKLFKYYDDMKALLKTDGSGWSKQIFRIIKPKSVRGTRAQAPVPMIKNPCEQIMYLKHDGQEVEIPMPSIDWKTHTMFLALTNQPLVDLRSPNAGSVLKQFHQVATACERSILPNRRYFQGSFEDWVNGAILPHLSDDDLYTAFKGILSLIDCTNTNTLVDKEKEERTSKSWICYLKCMYHNMSTKTMVIVIILALEIMFCIPTVLYCTLKKKIGSNIKFDPNVSITSSRRSNKSCSDQKRVAYNEETVFYQLSSNGSSFDGPDRVPLKIKSSSFVNYKVLHDKVSTHQSPATASRRSYSSFTDAGASTPEEELSRQVSNESTLPQNSAKLTETDWIKVNQGETQVSRQRLLSRRSSTSTAIHFSSPKHSMSKHSSKLDNYSNDTGETITLSTVPPHDKSKLVRKSKRFRPRHLIEPMSPESYDPFSCCILNNVAAPHKTSETSTPVQNIKFDLYDVRLTDVNPHYVSENATDSYSSHPSKTRTKNSEIICDRSIPSVRTPMRQESTRAIKDAKELMVQRQVSTPSESWRDITRPRISANASKHETNIDCEGATCMKGILKSPEKRTTKTSRIPKKVTSIAPSSGTPSPRPIQRKATASPTVRRSKIPKPERALDDSAIHSSSPRNDKLNVTL